MSCLTFVETKGVAVTGTATQILPYNVHRKGLFLAAHGGDVEVAVGVTPAAADYFTIKADTEITFDTLKPIGAIWVKGTGTLIYGESQ